MSYQNAKIKDIVERLNVSYFIPDIQRDYVWLRNAREKKIEQLFDSLYRGYPIGSFLFWSLNKNDIETERNASESTKLNFQLYEFILRYDERNEFNNQINVEQLNCNDLKIVLDGQQRLTSLYIGLKGSRTLRKARAWANIASSWVEKKLYMNLLYEPSEDNPDDNYQFVFLTPSEAAHKDEKTSWFKVGKVLDFSSDSEIENYCDEKGYSRKEERVILKLYRIFCVHELISYYEETEKDLNKVLKIFIRVNSGGTQLSYSDLLMSILTANFSSDIRGEMQRRIKSIRDMGFGVFGRDQILKTCLMLCGCSTVFKLSNFNRNNINKIEEEWEQNMDVIVSALILIEQAGYANILSSGYVVSVIACYLKKHRNVLTKDDREAIHRFIRNVQIVGYFSSSLDTKLRICSDLVKSYDSFEDINVQLTQQPTQYALKLTTDDIDWIVEGANFNSSTVLPVLQMLYPNLDYANTKFHIDHIYPRSKFDKKNKALDGSYLGRQNELFNLQMLEGHDNVSKNDKDPEVWMKETFLTEEADNLYRERNYIPLDFTLSWENIKDFEEKRLSLIKNKLYQILDAPEPTKELEEVDSPIISPLPSVQSTASHEPNNGTGSLQQEFWTEFNKRASANLQFSEVYRIRKPHKQGFYDLALGVSAYHTFMTVGFRDNCIASGIYFEGHREIYNDFVRHKEEIETMLGFPLDWNTGNTDARFKVIKSISVSDRYKWPEAIDWLIEMTLLFRTVHLRFSNV